MPPYPHNHRFVAKNKDKSILQICQHRSLLVGIANEIISGSNIKLNYCDNIELKTFWIIHGVSQAFWKKEEIKCWWLYYHRQFIAHKNLYVFDDNTQRSVVPKQNWCKNFLLDIFIWFVMILFLKKQFFVTLACWNEPTTC